MKISALRPNLKKIRNRSGPGKTEEPAAANPPPPVTPLKTRVQPQRRILKLSGDEIAAETQHGFFLVVPAWNVDVAIGILRDGVIEPWTNAVFLSLIGEGDQVVNVGANFGYYSALAAQRVGAGGSVHAIEANPAVFPYLLKSMYWSGFSDIIQAYNFAATTPASHRQPLQFAYDPQFMGGGNLFARARQTRPQQACLWSAENVMEVLDEDRRFIPRGLFHEVETEGRMLDALISHPVQAMLIDAEGSEPFVIEGAHQMIAKSPGLSIVMEWDPFTYRNFPDRRPVIDAMWNFLLDQQGFRPRRICPEGYAGVGSMPRLEPLNRDALYEVPHSDILLTRPT